MEQPGRGDTLHLVNLEMELTPIAIFLCRLPVLVPVILRYKLLLMILCSVKVIVYSSAQMIAMVYGHHYYGQPARLLQAFMSLQAEHTVSQEQISRVILPVIPF